MNQYRPSFESLAELFKPQAALLVREVDFFTPVIHCGSTFHYVINDL